MAMAGIITIIIDNDSNSNHNSNNNNNSNSHLGLDVGGGSGAGWKATAGQRQRDRRFLNNRYRGETLRTRGICSLSCLMCFPLFYCFMTRVIVCQSLAFWWVGCCPLACWTPACPHCPLAPLAPLARLTVHLAVWLGSACLTAWLSGGPSANPSNPPACLSGWLSLPAPVQACPR